MGLHRYAAFLQKQLLKRQFLPVSGNGNIRGQQAIEVLSEFAKNAEISSFQASSDNTPMAKGKDDK